MENVLRKQDHRCAKCNRVLNVVDYHHKDGNRSNNKESNCQALCPNCHADITRRGNK
jgi:5-methylcytosine-specific restriction endonuclease McrA